MVFFKIRVVTVLNRGTILGVHSKIKGEPQDHSVPYWEKQFGTRVGSVPWGDAEDDLINKETVHENWENPWEPTHWSKAADMGRGWEQHLEKMG